MLLDGRFLTGVAVGVAGVYAYRRWVKPRPAPARA